MTSFKKAVSSVAVACVACGVLTLGAFASTTNANAATSTKAVNSLTYEFNGVYQEYTGLVTDPITRYASSKAFTTTVTTFRGPKYPARATALPYASDAGAYSYTAYISDVGTYSANYIYYSPSSTESREEVMGLGFDSRETPGSRLKVVGTFYPNGK